jgi:CBS domain-containing protein
VTVEDVMTRHVITVRPETTVHEAARLMFTNRISGIPVVDESGRVVGIVSDGDLIVRQRRPKPKPWWRLFFENGERLVREYQKIVGLTVADVMTRPALVISPVFGIETAAAILDNRQIRRLPVVRDGQLVGIVSRGDLIKALAAAKPPTVESPASDASQPSTGKRDRPRQRTGEPYDREPKMKRSPLK